MSKVLIIGLAVAALGIGGIALPSEKSSNDPVETAFVSDAAAVVPALASSVPVGPFVRSAALCNTIEGIVQPDGYIYLCTPAFNGRQMTLGETLRVIPLERVREFNGWRESEVSLDTLVPRGSRYIYTRRTPEEHQRVTQAYARITG